MFITPDKLAVQLKSCASIKKKNCFEFSDNKFLFLTGDKYSRCVKCGSERIVKKCLENIKSDVFNEVNNRSP